MSDILSVVASALRADQSKLEQSSLNAANAATPGYKRASLVAQSFDQVLGAQQSTGAAHKSGDTWRAPTYVLNKVTDFSAGALQQTGRALDVAVEGKGFLQLTNGTQTWLTRTASLQVNAQGDLVGPKGLRVVGDLGELRAGGDKGLSISASGELQRGDQVLGRIKLVVPADDSALNSSDGVLFEASQDQLQDAPPDQGVIRAGFLEGSNTSNLKEMLGVMESVRHFESLIRLAQGYDEVMGRAIQKLGEG
mgnify:CR=1 FL=1